MEANQATDRWLPHLRNFVPGFLAAHPGLRPLADRAAVLLHGSTTFGIDDAVSDLDLWLLLPEKALDRFDEASDSRFIQFMLLDKQGHFSVGSTAEFARRIHRCDFPLISELRQAHLLADPEGSAAPLLESTRRPMCEAVRLAWFRYHYIRHRSEHRAADNPIERGDAVAILQASTAALTNALQAAMVLDGEPYPYVKWLGRAAGASPTGRKLAPLIADYLDLLARDALRHPGPESHHPLSLKLKDIRRLLANAANARGIDEPWLTEWYLYIDPSHEGIRQVHW